jgi:thioesterase domain-containing protein
MSDLSWPVVFLSGAGGGAPDFSIFRKGAEDATRLEVISYPGWKRYIADDFSAEVLIADLVKEIEARVPHGPIRIVGLSIGGHFGYAAALRLQKLGRDIAGFCAIDSFMIASSKPSAGWRGRALAEGLEMLRGRRFGELVHFLRSKFWRLMARLAGNRLPGLVRQLSSLRSSPLSLDPIFEEELSMRLLIRAAAPWIGFLDREPVPLEAPATLLRTALVSADDVAWRRRCPGIQIFEIPGRHHNLFEPENMTALHEAFIAATRNWRPKERAGPDANNGCGQVRGLTGGANTE